MRTADFSQAPKVAQATSMFVGATKYRGPLAMIQLLPTWVKMVAMMKKMPGYCQHFVWYEFPFTLGTIAFFKDQDSLLRFARSKYHRDLMIWVTEGTKHATGGFIRLYDAQEKGYSNGVWRAEENVMKHIERFTPLSMETQGPEVNPHHV